MKYEITKKEYPSNIYLFVRNYNTGESVAECNIDIDGMDRQQKEKLHNKLINKICSIYDTQFDKNKYYYYLNKIKNSNF